MSTFSNSNFRTVFIRQNPPFLSSQFDAYECPANTMAWISGWDVNGSGVAVSNHHIRTIRGDGTTFDTVFTDAVADRSLPHSLSAGITTQAQYDFRLLFPGDKMRFFFAVNNTYYISILEFFDSTN